MTQRLEYETNKIDARAATWWQNRDTWSYEQALDYLKKSKFLDITHCVRIKTAPPALPKGIFGVSTNQFLGLWSFTNRSGAACVAATDFEPVLVQSLPA